MKFFKKDTGLESKAKDLQSFLDENADEFSVLMKDFEVLFNKIGETHGSEALQVAFMGTVFYSILNSVNCEKSNKKQLLKNLLKKL